MEFRTEFFPFLDNLFYKEGLDIQSTTIDSRDMYLMTRYASFYHPKIAMLLNNTLNKFNRHTDTFSGDMLYSIADGIIPALPFKRIKYISRPKVKNADTVNEFVDSYAERHNISKREVWGMIYQLNNLKMV